MSIRFAAGILAALTTVVPAFAQTPFLVADLDTTTPDISQSSHSDQFQVFGDTLFFSATTDANGRELWKYTAAEGASMVADIAPGSGSSWPGLLSDIGGGVFLFMANDLVHGLELWRTDGTEAGTTLVKDINPSGNGAGTPSAVLGGKLFFGGYDGVHGVEPWFSDGTAEGTQMLLDLDGLPASSNVGLIFAADGQLYLSGAGGLWVSDGTAEGTTRIATVGSASGAARMGSTLFFTATGDGSTGRELWKTDGTGPGTQLVKDIGAGTISGVSSTSLLASIGSTFYFTARTNSAGVQLWKTDGTTAGTELVKVLLEYNSAPPTAATLPNGTLYVEVAETVWRSDGTAAGTVPLLQNVFNLVSAFGRLYYIKGNSGGTTLWTSDGATHSPVLSMPQILWLTPAGGEMYFTGSDQHGYEPWVSEDGTAATTHRLANVNPDMAPSSKPEGLTAVGDIVFFRADDGSPAKKLFRSDGTAGGTFQLTDTDVREVTGRPNGAWFGDLESGLWRSDGTAAGTTRMRDFSEFGGLSQPQRLFPGSRSLFFSAGAPRGLWRADGTPAGTVNVSGGMSGGDLPHSPGTFAELAGRVYVHAGSNPTGIWATDGDAASLPDIATTRIFSVPDNSFIQPDSLTAAAGALYFSLFMPGVGHTLWRSDGAFGGGAPVKDAAGNPVSSPERLTAAGRYLYCVAVDAAHGAELWRTDGTAAGTVLVKDIVEGAPGAGIGSMAAAGELLYFVADNGIHGAELWRTDGTTAGAVMVADLMPGSLSSDPDGLVFANGTLWFTADNGMAGRELWRLDAGVPVMVADLAPGPEPSLPAEMEQAGALLFFSASTSFGRELWALPLDGAILGIDDVRIAEGTGGTRTMRFTVTRSGSVAGAASVAFTTGGGSASAGDYATHSGTLAFTDGETARFIDVEVQSDALLEGPESLFVTLSAPAGALLGKSVGLGIIDDDEQRAELSIVAVQTSENRRSFRITNAGPSVATGVQLRFSESPHPLTLTLSSLCFSHDNPLTCGMSSIPPGEAVFVSVDAVGTGYVDPNLPPGSTITATVSATELDGNPNDNVAANMFSRDGVLMLPSVLTANSTATAAVALDSSQTSTQQVSVILTSSSPNVVVSPSSVMIPQGQTSASFTLTIGAATGPVRLTAKPAGWPSASVSIPVVTPGGAAKLDVAIVVPSVVRVDHGEEVKIAASIAARRHDGTLPTGTVSLIEQNSQAVVAQETLDGTANAVFTKSDLPVGDHHFVVRYDGDANFNGIDGPVMLVDVNGLPTTVSLAAAQVVCMGSTHEVVATVRSTETTDAPTGTVQFSSSGGISPVLALTPTGVPGESRASWTASYTTGIILAQYSPTGVFASSYVTKSTVAHACVANLQATATSLTSVTLTWTPIPGSSRYQVHRYLPNLQWFMVGTVDTATTRTESGLEPMRSYLYVVDYYDAAMNYLGSTPPDVATTLVFDDDPIVPQVTRVRATHIEQLRMGANALRWYGQALDISAITPVPAGSAIRAEHITALRTDINAQRIALGVPAVAFTDPALAPGARIKRVHIEELRNAVK